MRKLITSIMALFATVAIQAQDIDTSSWTEGMDVSDQLNWGDYNGTFSGEKSQNNNGDYTPSTLGDYWKGTIPSEWNFLDDINFGAMAYYNDGAAGKELTNIYQVVYFPAGWYTIEVNALYREGTCGDSFLTFFNNTPKKNAWIYAAVLTSDDPESEVKTEYSTFVRSIASSECTERIHFDSDGSWKNDYSQAVGPKDEQVTYYCPQCLVGAIKYFEQGYYENSFDLVVTEPGYVKIGIRKTANISQDWLAFSDFHIIYNGGADEGAQLAMAQNDFYNASLKVEEATFSIREQGFGGLASIISDQLMTIDGETDTDNLESVMAATEKVNQLYDQAFRALQLANSLTELLEMSNDMMTSTDFPGKAAFQSKLDEISAKAKTDDAEDLNYDINSFNALFEELSKARADYLNTGDVDENGAKDFTALIKYPWFVNPEYTPELINGHYELTESSWTAGNNPTSYNNMKKNRTDISSKVVLSGDPTVTNQWYKLMNNVGWSPGLGLFWQGHLIGVSDGSNNLTGGSLEIHQQLVGLPNGYYSVKALVRGNRNNTFNDDNMPPYHNIFAQNSEEVVVKSPVGHTDSYYAPQYGWNEWQSFVWQEHKTGIIAVPDGRLLIGGQTSWVGNFTGFRLLFYGENPDFNAMIQEELDAIEENIGKLRFMGDSIKVREILANIVLPLPTPSDYETALQFTRDANDYMQLANNATRNYNTPKDYEDLSKNYDGKSDQFKILSQGLEYVTNLDLAETTVYTDIQGVPDVFNAYKNYLANYDKALTYDNDALKSTIAAQTAALKAGYSDVETLNAYSAELNTLINTAAIIAAGGKTASEENPVDITGLLKNPDFTSSPTNGWSGNSATSNDYARGNAEIWNASSIDFYQDIEGLPAGKYQIKVRALYRDARNVTDNDNQSWTSYWTDANGDVNVWARHYAELYAKTATAESAAYVKSVCDGKFTEPSFSRYVKQVIEGEFLTDPETGEVLRDPVTNEELIERDTVWYYFNDTTYVEETEEISGIKLHGYPFDETVETAEGTFYYPSSMYGAYCRFALSPEAYCNEVTIDVAKGETLRLGFRKSTSVSGDWVIFDDFQLFFLGGDLDTTGINAINMAGKAANIYNLQGQQLAAPQRGINIIGGKKVMVK